MLRDNVVIHDGKLISLKRMKDDAKEVAFGYECGIQIENFNDIKEGDIIEAFIMEQVKNLGYKIKLDTNGTNPEMIKFVHKNGLCDYFAMDIKNDLENYAEIIGFNKFDTKKIEETVDYFLSNKVDYEFRTTLIKEFHHEENILSIGKWLKGANKYFLQKFKNSESCIQSHLSAVEDKIAIKYVELLKEYIPSTHLRGY